MLVLVVRMKIQRVIAEIRQYKLSYITKILRIANKYLCVLKLMCKVFIDSFSHLYLRRFVVWQALQK